MRQPLLAAALLTGLIWFSTAQLAGAASIEAGTFMNVTVDAPLYDTSLATAGGCDPAGCTGGLTRVSQAGCMQGAHPSMHLGVGERQHILKVRPVVDVHVYRHACFVDFHQTQDGDTTSTSRWSCSISLGDISSACTITYTLANSSTLEALQVGESGPHDFVPRTFGSEFSWKAPMLLTNQERGYIM